MFFIIIIFFKKKIFFFVCSKHRLSVNEYPQSMFRAKIRKKYTLVYCKSGLRVGINNTGVYRDVLPGLCGLYNQDSADDLTLRNGTAVSIGDKDKFGNDWAIVPGNKYLSGVKRKPSFLYAKQRRRSAAQ